MHRPPATLCALRHGLFGMGLGLAIASCLLAFPRALAGSRLAFTGAATSIEGGGGAGLATWALIGGLGTEDEWSPTVAFSHAETQDFALDVAAVSVGAWNRVELSFARQRFDAGSVVPGLTLGQDIVGVKLRVAGDAIFDGDRPWPQLSIGAQHKKTRDFEFIPRAVGAERDSATEIYVSATKLYFAAVADRDVIVNATLRRTDANQYGLLGFGGPARRSPAWRPELSVGVWPHERVLVGVEYRDKADALNAFAEDAAVDAFIAWAPNRRILLVAGWLDLGSIAGSVTQRGSYLSLWASY
jgi:hypothetical protein